MNIRNNNKKRFFLAARPRLQRWAGWAFFAGVIGGGGLALGSCDSSTARGALALLHRLLWA